MSPITGDRPSSARLTIVIDEIEIRGHAHSAAAIATAVERSVMRDPGLTMPAATRIAVAREVAGAVGSIVAAPARGRSHQPGRAGS